MFLLLLYLAALCSGDGSGDGADLDTGLDLGLATIAWEAAGTAYLGVFDLNCWYQVSPLLTINQPQPTNYQIFPKTTIQPATTRPS